MGWGAQQWLRITKEATYGTFNGSAAPSDIIWIRLVGDNPFTMRAVPQRQVIRSADGGNRRVQQVAPRKLVQGNLNTLCYPSQMAYLLGAALTLTSNELSSYTFDYFDTVQGMRFLGTKIASLGYTSGSDSDYCSLALTLQAQSRTTVTLAQPAFSVFPTDTPYVHFETLGQVSVGGSTLAKYKQISFTINNVLAPTWDEDQWITSLYYAGRDVNGSINPQYASATLRTAFESQSALAVSMAWQRAAGLLTTLDMKGVNYIPSVDDDLKLGGASYQMVNFEAFYDGSASTDCSFTVA